MLSPPVEAGFGAAVTMLVNVEVERGVLAGVRLSVVKITKVVAFEKGAVEFERELEVEMRVWVTVWFCVTVVVPGDKVGGGLETELDLVLELEASVMLTSVIVIVEWFLVCELDAAEVTGVAVMV